MRDGQAQKRRVAKNRETVLLRQYSYSAILLILLICARPGRATFRLDASRTIRSVVLVRSAAGESGLSEPDLFHLSTCLQGDLV